ncbi:hypothetical protein KsCSTR_12020 [Candidatus Kuenenia stuttgartiensis]|uniref:Uncharacterized protein n=1 Tax=Kuenenia stuttgartiensis TaxID=174633 RepID=Q1PYA7_KUEST|nr:hypothetical protein KsCSTR_12020 [Candidatus Kuenenia stuttgartiensis]CAJ72066.1 unknown protein [Candidatus Kuenenia stuttgartiensis]
MPILFFIRSWSFSNNPVPKPELGNERFFFIELKCYNFFYIFTAFLVQHTIKKHLSTSHPINPHNNSFPYL